MPHSLLSEPLPMRYIKSTDGDFLPFMAEDVVGMRILVAGVGNVLLGDDGLGPRLVERIREKLPPDVEVEDYGNSMIELLYDMADFDALIVVDAVSKGGKPGDIFVEEIEPGDIENIDPEKASSLMHMSYHEADLESVLALAKALGFLPKKVFIVGVEPENVAVSTSLSVPVIEVLDRVERIILGIIDNLKR